MTGSLYASMIMMEAATSPFSDIVWFWTTATL